MTATPRLLAAALFAVLATTACKRDAQAPTPGDTPSQTGTTAPAPLPPAMPSASPPAAGMTVSNVELGNAIGRDNRVTTAMTTFSPRDTIYATVTVAGAGAGAGQLGARWTFQDGQEVHSETKALTAGGPTTHEFHVSKPDGWPAGRYRVEIRVDGNAVQTRDFEVR